VCVGRFVLTLAVVISGCAGSASPTVRVGTLAKPPPSRFLRVHAARRAVELTLIAGDGSRNNGFNFDGYGRGELLVSVPRGWLVTVHFRNASSRRSSCAVVAGPSATRPAFAGASTSMPLVGLGNGGTATFSFSAAVVGTYRIASLVLGQELARMWDVLVVTRDGHPSIRARPGP
jgi:hypothetical protein